MKTMYSKEKNVPLRIQFEKGHRAFHRGKITNPYKSNTSFYQEWERGFNKAYFENLEIHENMLVKRNLSVSQRERLVLGDWNEKQNVEH